MEYQITQIERMSGNDVTLEFAVRYRLASDPDIDASYIPVVTTKDIASVILPFFDPSGLPTGTYVVHSYYIPDGNTTGTKITIDVVADPV